MLTLQRRHSPTCPDREKAPTFSSAEVGACCEPAGPRKTAGGCEFPSRPGTSTAARRLTEIEDRMSGKPRKTDLDAVTAFQAQHEENADETKRRYKRLLRYFTEFCARER